MRMKLAEVALSGQTMLAQEFGPRDGRYLDWCGPQVKAVSATLEVEFSVGACSFSGGCGATGPARAHTVSVSRTYVLTVRAEDGRTLEQQKSQKWLDDALLRGVAVGWGEPSPLVLDAKYAAFSGDVSVHLNRG